MRIGVVTITLLVLTSAQLLFATPAKSQPIDKVEINLGFNNETLIQAFQKIESKTAFYFMYRNDEVKNIRGLKLKSSTQSVEWFLKAILTNTSLTYRQMNNQILIMHVEKDFKDPTALLVSRDEKLQNVPVANIVTGRVSNSKGEPLVGVSVTVKGMTTGTSTDANGNYSIDVPANGALVFSYVGYATKEMPVNERSSVDLVMEESVSTLDQVVIVGYGTQKKTSVTSAISTIKGNEIASIPLSNLSNAIGGRASGVIFRQNSGEPGKDGATINIRGIATTGNSAPLVVVDGIPRDFEQLDPNTIKSFTILKDAAAVAPYGVAGANGVILVTTKSGVLGAPRLSYDAFVGIQNPTRLTKQVNSSQYAQMRNAAADNEGTPRPFSDYDIQKFKDGSDPDGHPNSSPLRDISRPNSIIMRHGLQLSGGSEKFTYYTSLGFFQQNGMWPSTNDKKYNFTVNLDAHPTKTTEVALIINSWVEDKAYPAYSPTDNIFYQAFRTPPTSPVRYSNGLWGGYISRSLYGEVYHSGYENDEGTTIQSQISIEQQLPFIKGLSVKGLVSFDPTFNEQKIWNKPVPYYAVDTTTRPYTYNNAVQGLAKPTISENYSKNKNITYQGYLNYKNNFGLNHVGALAVVEYRNGAYHTFGASRQNSNVNIDEINAGSSNKNDFDNFGLSTESKQLGLVYRITYDHANKYLFEVSGRYDGNYYFAPGGRWGYFPAFSAGWRMSEENFIKNNFSWIDDLKIRGSWGESGNLAGLPFQYLSTFSLYGNAYAFGTAEMLMQGLRERSEANPFITWEKAKKTDLGLEFSLWGGLLNFEADYFYELRDNMLVNQPNAVPASYGIALSQVNAGKMNNKGFDFSLSSNYQLSNNLKVNLSTNFTYAKNKLLKVFENSSTYDNVNRRRTGRSYNTVFAYKALGYFQTSDDKNGDGIITSSEYPIVQFGTLHPGDIKYQDTNNDGKITPDDYIPIGNSSVPQIIYGFSPGVSFKGLALNLLFQGAANVNYYFSGDLAFPFNNASSATLAQMDYWTPQKTNAEYPRIYSSPPPNNSQTSSHWIKNASYLRLKSALLEYALPQKVINSLKLKYVKIYLSGENISTWSKIKSVDIDPEVGDPQGHYYPQQRVFSFGVNITF